MGPHERLDRILSSELPSTAKLVLAAISHHLIDKDYCWPSQTTLARLTSLHRVTVVRTLADLQHAKILTGDQGKRGKTLTYTVHWDRVGTCSTEQPVAESYTPTCSTELHPPVAADYNPCSTELHPLLHATTPPVAESYTEGEKKGEEKRKKKPKTAKGEGAAKAPLSSEESEEEQEPVISPVVSKLTELKKQYPSSESVEQLRDLWHGGVRQRLLTIYPAASSPELLAMVEEAAAEEFGGEVAIGAIFSQPDKLERLEESVAEQLARLEDQLDGEAAQIARGWLTREELVPKHSPAELARIDWKAAEIIAYEKRRAAECEAAIAATEATLPAYEQPKLNLAKLPSDIPANVRERLMKEAVHA